MKLLDAVVYPESDGKPMADATKQGRWMVTLHGNIEALFRDQPDVFVAINVFWYPKKGEDEVRTAPDVMVVCGRPKGDRSSYQQWEENDVPVTVAFEVLAPGNTVTEMDDKQDFYEEHGVEEYYIYNPDNNRLRIFLRHGDVFRRFRPAHNFVSPRLGIRFDLSGPEMTVYYPDGRRFLTFEEMEADRTRQRQRADRAEQRATRLAELGRKARRGQASVEELQELIVSRSHSSRKKRPRNSPHRRVFALGKAE